MLGFFSLPREHLMPFCDVSSTHCSEGRTESGGRGGRDSLPESVENHCLPYNKSLYTYLQCALWG